MEKVKIEGTAPVLIDGAKYSGEVDLDRNIRVTLVLRSRETQESWETISVESLHKHLELMDIQDMFGASQVDIEKLIDFARDNDFLVDDFSEVFRFVTLYGPIRKFNHVFEISIKNYRHQDFPDSSFLFHHEDIALPLDLAEIVQCVLGLCTQPLFKREKKERKIKRKPMIRMPDGYLPTDIARHYNFPANLTGKGESIAIFEISDCGYWKDELKFYFKDVIGLKKCPKIIPVSVKGKEGNTPGVFCSDLEVYMDTEIVGSIAPEAKIFIYFTSNDLQGLKEALKKMLTGSHTIFSISWGIPEKSIPKSYENYINFLLFVASSLGITVCVSSGDGGPSSTPWNQKDGINMLAASPWVLACGGTMFAPGQQGEEEVVWNEEHRVISSDSFCKQEFCDLWETSNDLCKLLKEKTHFASGGGESCLFERPQYQLDAGIETKGEDLPERPNVPPGRLIPDVAGYASLGKGYNIFLHQTGFSGGGTSASTPLYAALFALINQALRGQNKPRLGFINPLLYKMGQSGEGNIFKPITKGNNLVDGKGYIATPGWNACTGWGAIDGTRLLEYVLEIFPQLETY